MYSFLDIFLIIVLRDEEEKNTKRERKKEKDKEKSKGVIDVKIINLTFKIVGLLLFFF